MGVKCGIKMKLAQWGLTAKDRIERGRPDLSESRWFWHRWAKCSHRTKMIAIRGVFIYFILCIGPGVQILHYILGKTTIVFRKTAFGPSWLISKYAPDCNYVLLKICWDEHTLSVKKALDVVQKMTYLTYAIQFYTTLALKYF